MLRCRNEGKAHLQTRLLTHSPHAALPAGRSALSHLRTAKEMKEKHFSGVFQHFSGNASLFTCLIVTLLWLLCLLQYLLTFHSLKIICFRFWLTTAKYNHVQKRWSMKDKTDARKVSASIIWKSISYCNDWCVCWKTVLNLGRFIKVKDSRSPLNFWKMVIKSL